MLAKIPKSAVGYIDNSTSQYWFIRHHSINKLVILRFLPYIYDQESEAALDPVTFCELVPHERIIWAGQMPDLANEFFYKGPSEVQGPQAKAIVKSLSPHPSKTIITRVELRSILEAAPYLVTKQDVMEVFARNYEKLTDVIVVHKDIL